jgi:hypothetical protein
MFVMEGVCEGKRAKCDLRSNALCQERSRSRAARSRTSRLSVTLLFPTSSINHQPTEIKNPVEISMFM